MHIKPDDILFAVILAFFFGGILLAGFCEWIYKKGLPYLLEMLADMKAKAEAARQYNLKLNEKSYNGGYKK